MNTLLSVVAIVVSLPGRSVTYAALTARARKRWALSRSNGSADNVREYCRQSLHAWSDCLPCDITSLPMFPHPC